MATPASWGYSRQMALRQVARSAAQRVAPGWMAERARRYERGFREREGVTTLAETFAAEHGYRVSAGPFEGMQYHRELAGVDAPIAKLVGTYEQELHAPLERFLARRPRAFVDFGCADGYYAVGVALRAPGAPVHAFDLAPSARRACARLAALNGVGDRIAIGGAARLDSLPLDGALVLCDIEGGEMDLLDEGAARLARGAMLMVELHEHQSPGVTEVLLERFAQTHRSELVRSRPRDAAPASLNGLSADARALALTETRGEMAWAIFTPRAA